MHGPHDEPVRRFLESVLGWQVIDTATANLLPPAVRIVDTTITREDLSTPTILLIGDDESAKLVGDACVQCRPDAIVRWPDDRERVGEIVERVLDTRPSAEASGTRVLRVGGSAGGVGTTTLALAFAGLAGWRRWPSVAALRSGEFVSSHATIDAAACSSPDLYARATPLDGCATARVVVTSGTVGSPTDPSLRLLVVDVGVTHDADVLVAGRDRAGLDAARRSTAGLVVAVGAGPASLEALAEASGGRRVVAVPTSARVRNAGFRQRLPAGLPGRWLQPLEPIVGGLR